MTDSSRSLIPRSSMAEIAPRLFKALEQVRRNRCDLTCGPFTSAGGSFPICWYCGEPVLWGQGYSSWPMGDDLRFRGYAHVAVGNYYRFGGWG